MASTNTVADYRDRRDKRRRLLALTNSGRYYFSGLSAHAELESEQLLVDAGELRSGCPMSLRVGRKRLAAQPLSQRFDAVLSPGSLSHRIARSLRASFESP